MQERRYQVQRKLGFLWIGVDEYITEEVARIEARRMSGTTRVVPVWIEK
jgi:hypothetical protein